MSELKKFFDFSGHPAILKIEACHKESQNLESKIVRYRKYPDGALMLMIRTGHRNPTEEATLNRDVATYVLLERGIQRTEIEHMLSRL